MKLLLPSVVKMAKYAPAEAHLPRFLSLPRRLAKFSKKYADCDQVNAFMAFLEEGVLPSTLAAEEQRLYAWATMRCIGDGTLPAEVADQFSTGMGLDFEPEN